MTLVAFAAMSASAWADELSVLVANTHFARGEGTTIGVHAATGETYGGGHIELRYHDAASNCAPTPAEDGGTDISGSPAPAVAAGVQTADAGGQVLSPGVGDWRVCGWLLDDAAGTVTASGSQTFTVVPYIGKAKVHVTKSQAGNQVVIEYESSAAARLFATVRSAKRGCPRNAARARGDALLLLPKLGRTIGGSGGVGRAIKSGLLEDGRYRVCAWIQEGARSGTPRVGPVTTTFSVT